MMFLARLLVSMYLAVITTALVSPKPGLKSYTDAERKHTLFALRGRDIESDNLLSILSEDGTDISGQKKKSLLRKEVSSLESLFISEEQNDDPTRFNPLIGLYEVAHVITNNDKENPVGGKWTRSDGFAQKLFKTRKTYQHILPYNSTGLARYDGETSVAEAINVVSLDGLDGLLRATVILRGDVVPLSSEELKDLNANRKTNLLSNLAIRAHFDAPRIFVGKRQLGSQDAFKYLPLQLGPLSDVILDTSFNDQYVRIGMGGTSGTRFVFTRTADEEAKEYEALLQQPPAKKSKLLGITTSILLMSFYIAFGNGTKLAAAMVPSFISKSTLLSPSMVLLNFAKMSVERFIRVIAGATGLVPGLGALLIAFSSGGIEGDGMQPKAA